MSFERIAEEKIREAIEQGSFSDLAGAGKPLAILADEYTGDDWLSMHMLRQNGFLPEWLELRRQIYYDREKVNAARRSWEDNVARWGSPDHVVPAYSRKLLTEQVKAINAKIDLHNIRCPSIAFEIARFRDEG
jgi:hypothetical protein